ncbi:cystathionine gamma-lyase [Streptomyces sp. 3MP-14]|uniref:Cystathionine gamma-lyase n=1 Tax=Streptomyces mimosae TaxID=2586635 RepID=A0A5N6A4D0_9ACTN|nr:MULTISPECIES: cystathionine gamma-lyase [Streptomyces]KAB8163295.1 cystathionine gamma-lyase [Streptomyces mimosae]KAB8174572.1 cystathionine gamma-lyase [Streptomyces sp. 3MP-14]
MTGDGTRAVRAGLPAVEPYQPPMPPPVLAAHYHLPGDPAVAPFGYGRENNPTWVALERAIAELESPEPEDGAQALVFPSGMAAISATLLSLTRPGDSVVLPSDGYQIWPKLRQRAEERGVRTHTAPTGGDGQLAALAAARGRGERVRLLWLETPSNPGLDVCDIARLAREAHAQGALVAVDNTLATPLGQRPLELGADLAVASGTKALNGHGDVLLGYVAARDPELIDEIRQWRTVLGAIPGPLEAWLAHRGLATLQLRVARQAENALAVARALAARPEVTGLRHPGLPEDRDHALAARQMRFFGCVVSFTLPDREHAERFLAALRLVDDATSFGGVRSTAERRGRWGGDAVPEGFVRLSVGIEDPEDLVADIRRALEAAAA